MTRIQQEIKKFRAVLIKCIGRSKNQQTIVSVCDGFFEPSIIEGLDAS